jgi:hypothetical protein
MEYIYSIMGVCPQHDLLWDTLTGREHLLFYGRLKGLTGGGGGGGVVPLSQGGVDCSLAWSVGGEVVYMCVFGGGGSISEAGLRQLVSSGTCLLYHTPKQWFPVTILCVGPELVASVESSLRAVNLWNNKVADKQARQYSGGMKRRLSVAISFMGDPLVVYLDEPSTVSRLRGGGGSGPAAAWEEGWAEGGKGEGECVSLARGVTGVQLLVAFHFYGAPTGGLLKTTGAWQARQVSCLCGGPGGGGGCRLRPEGVRVVQL